MSISPRKNNLRIKLRVKLRVKRVKLRIKLILQSVLRRHIYVKLASYTSGHLQYLISRKEIKKINQKRP
jgi:hypothetical protein